jgi:hypothetical protein
MIIFSMVTLLVYCTVNVNLEVNLIKDFWLQTIFFLFVYFNTLLILNKIFKLSFKHITNKPFIHC